MGSVQGRGLHSEGSTGQSASSPSQEVCKRGFSPTSQDGMPMRAPPDAPAEIPGLAHPSDSDGTFPSLPHALGALPAHSTHVPGLTRDGHGGQAAGAVVLKGLARV